jgi:hypothetical protein
MSSSIAQDRDVGVVTGGSGRQICCHRYSTYNMRVLVKILIVSPLIASLLVALNVTATARANGGPVNTEWTVPVNLSQSGAATKPRMLIDSSGTMHLIWSDSFAGFVYSQSQGEHWSEPVAVTFPFTESGLSLVIDGSDRLHAIWPELDGALLYSQAAVADVTDADAWTLPRPLATAALRADLVVDSLGRLHLSYVRALATDDEPAGVYYQRSDDSGTTWLPPQLLYESSYFRSLLPENSHVQIAIGASRRLFIVWDNRRLDKVFFIRSRDGGMTWTSPLEIDRREAIDATAATGPSQILVRASGDNVHLLWQAGHEERHCGQYHQWSPDGGANWKPRQLFDTIPGCPEGKWLRVADDGRLLFLASVEGRNYLVVWDRDRWSEWQLQSSLSTLLNPETHRPIELACQQLALHGDDRLYLVGCDTGSSGDIWLTTRLLGTTADWFPPPPIWQAPLAVAESEAEIDEHMLVADPVGRLHLFWTEIGTSLINYSRFDNGHWSRPQVVLRSPRGDAVDVNLAVGAEGRLSVMWRDSYSGQLYFSQVDADRAFFPTDWLAPQSLPWLQPAINSLDMLVVPDGRIYVAYAVAVNEWRGVYIARSENNGQSWTEPLLIFDAAVAGWDMIGKPRLAATGDDELHITWNRYSVPPAGDALNIYYARSSDGGESWSAPQTVVERVSTWNDLIGIGERTVHRLWQENRDGFGWLWHETSFDNGLTWNPPLTIAGIPGGETLPALVLDSAGRMQLLQISGTLLQQWTWDGSRWLRQESVALATIGATSSSLLAAAVPVDGDLTVVYTAVPAGVPGEPVREQLLFSARPLDYPLEKPTPLPTLTATPQPMPTSTLAPTSTPPATVAFPVTSAEGAGANLAGANNSWAGITAGIIPAGAAVLLVLILAVRAVWKGGR